MSHKEGAKILFGEGRYYCDACAFYSEELSEIRIHRNSKHNMSLYNCQLCGFQSKSEQNMSLHNETSHNGVKLLCYNCDSKAAMRQLYMSDIPTNTIHCGNCVKSAYFAYQPDGFNTRIQEKHDL